MNLSHQLHWQSSKKRLVIDTLSDYVLKPYKWKQWGELNWRESNSARQLNTQINETKNETQKNPISLQNKTQATRIKDLEIIQHDLEQTVNYLKLNIEDFKEREKLYREAEELYEPNFQDIADQTYDTTWFLEELRNSSICKELNSKGTQPTLDLQQILKRNTDQANLISALQEKNSKLLDK